MISSGEPDSSPSGQELLAEFMQYGRQRPFEEIVRRYAGMVFNVCLRVTKDKHDAEDATQAVFLTLALQAKRGADIKALGPWLQQVAKRLSLDLRRSKSRRKNREERHHEEQTVRRESIIDAALPTADLDEIKIILHEELTKLPTKYRLPLILHYFGGLTREEMAEELNCKPSTLGVRIFRGREMLAGRLTGRGVSISSATLTVALAYTVKGAISDALVCATSHAASALAAGHDCVGLVSSQVIGLTRRAGGALVIGKVKYTVIVVALSCTTLGATAKAFGMLPGVDVQQLISNQVQRLIRPLFQPFTIPLRVDATPKPSKPGGKHAMPRPTFTSPADSIAMVPPVWPSTPARVSLPATPSADVGIPSAVSIAPAPALDFHVTTPEPGLRVTLPYERTPAVVAAASSTNRTAAPATPEAPAPVAAASSDRTTDSGIPSSARSSNLPIAAMARGGGSGGGSLAAMASGPASSSAAAWSPAGLYVPPLPNAARTSVGSSVMSGTFGSLLDSGVASPTVAMSAGTTAKPAVVRVPTASGSVTASAGIVRGWGKIDRTGTLDVSGQVIADGHGVDRTLNLLSFTAVRNDADNSTAGGCAGWYAQNHGRLALPLQVSTDHKDLVWGEDPADPVLDLVNSVRLQPTTDEPAPGQLALLSLDRQDVPDVAGLTGVPVGLWQVDPSASPLSAADLTVRYNDTLINHLGASESSVTLWSYSGDAWQAVDPNSVTLDTSDHLITGVASDFSYFAVTVPPADGVDAAMILAQPMATAAPSVPEPASLGIVTLGATFLLRRRRRVMPRRA